MPQRIRQLIEAHSPVDALEAAHRRRLLEFVDGHEAPFDRRIVEGHLTASAFVLDPDRRLLLTHHRRLDLWLQLGGHAEDGESDAAAIALREAREESGLQDLAFDERLLDASGRPRLLDLDVHAIPPHDDEPEHEHLDLRFLLRTARPDAVRREPRESKAMRWVTLAEARRLGDESLARAVRRIEALA